MHRFINSLASLLVLSGPLFSQVQVNVEWTGNSPVKMPLTNSGIFGLDLAGLRAGTLWPRDSDDQFLFGGGVWIGGWVREGSVSMPFVMSTYDPTSAQSDAVPGDAVKREVIGDVERLTTFFAFRDKVDPVGLQVTQTLETHASGALRDVALLHVKVRNNNPTKPLSQCVLSIVLDVEVGKASAPMLAAQQDVLSVVEGRPELAIMKAHNAAPSSNDNNGVLAVASIGTTSPERFLGVQPLSLATFPSTNGDRFLSMTTGKIVTTTTGSDLMIVASLAAKDLDPGEERTATFALMFSTANDAASDARFIEIVEGLRKATTVDEIIQQQAGVSAYPNPTNGATHLAITAAHNTYQVTLVDLMGRVVRTSRNTTEPFDISGLPNGSYIVQLVGPHTVEGLPIVFNN